MRQRLTGALIGGIFGLVFVIANARTPLGATVAALFRILAFVGFIALVLARRRALSDPRAARSAPATHLFGRRYWLIVAAEVGLLAVGYVALIAAGAPDQAGVAWIALVVGLHFLAFRVAGVWGGGSLRSATPLVILGAAGLVMAAAGAASWVPLVSGVLSGFTLLTGSLSVTLRAVRAPRATAPQHDRRTEPDHPPGHAPRAVDRVAPADQASAPAGRRERGSRRYLAAAKSGRRQESSR